MRISDILIRDAIVTDLKATTKEDAFRELVSSVQGAGHVVKVDPEELSKPYNDAKSFLRNWWGEVYSVPRAAIPVSIVWLAPSHCPAGG